MAWLTNESELMLRPKRLDPHSPLCHTGSHGARWRVDEQAPKVFGVTQLSVDPAGIVWERACLFKAFVFLVETVPPRGTGGNSTLGMWKKQQVHLNTKKDVSSIPPLIVSPYF